MLGEEIEDPAVAAGCPGFAHCLGEREWSLVAPGHLLCGTRFVHRDQLAVFRPEFFRRGGVKEQGLVLPITLPIALWNGSLPRGHDVDRWIHGTVQGIDHVLWCGLGAVDFLAELRDRAKQFSPRHRSPPWWQRGQAATERAPSLCDK